MSVRKSLLKLVVFAIVTTFVTLQLARTIANTQSGDTVRYRAQFSDITGLLPGDDVRIAGVPAGRVTSTKVVGNRAEVEFKLRDNIPLTTSVKAKIRYRNLLGQRYVSLSEGSGGNPLRPGSLIPIGQTESALDLTMLFNGFKPILQTVRPEDVNKLAEEIIKTLQGEGGTIDSLLESTASLTNTLADRDAAIGRVVTNLSLVTQTIAERDETLSQFIKELQRLVTGLAGDRDAIGDSLSNIDALASATAGLVRDARPSIQPAVRDLAVLLDVAAGKSKELDTVVKQLPGALQALSRATSYGAWLNLYVLDLRVQINDTIIPIPPAAVASALRAAESAGRGATPSAPAGGGRR